MTLIWRPIARDDVPAWNWLLAAAEAVDDTGEHYDDSDLHEELDDPVCGPNDKVGAWEDGTLVAFAAVRPRDNPVGYLRVNGEGVTHPQWRGRGLGTSSVGLLRRRTAALLAERKLSIPAHLEVGAGLDNPGQTSLLADNGFAAVHWEAVMRAPLDDGRELPEPRWPSGTVVRPYEASWSGRMREAHNEAFLDHWGFTPWSERMWRQWIETASSFRPDVSWLVVDEGRPDVVVGYLQTSEWQAQQAATGRREAYIAKLGVRRSYRGRGMASALLWHALREYRAAGYDESALDVDTNNPTGAFGLYQRTGFIVERQSATYSTTIAPPTPQSV